jgi:hypothetical protein
LDLTEGSETSAKLNLTPGKYPKENIQVSEHGENLKSRVSYMNLKTARLRDRPRNRWQVEVMEVG